MFKSKPIIILTLYVFMAGCSTTYYTRLPEEKILSQKFRNIKLADLEFFYSYKKKTEDFEVRLIKENQYFKLYQIRFPFALNNLFSEKDFVYFKYYLPKGEGKFPAVVILPHLAGTSGLETFFAQGLLRNNFAILEIGEPYFAEDRREGRWWMHKLQKPKDLEKIKMLFRQLVIDTRRGIDFLERQPNIDKNRLGLLGLSLGGCFAVLVSGIDQRVEAIVFLLSGGDLVPLVKESQYAEILRQHMERGNINFESMEESWREIEPLVLAPYIRNRPVLMINATFDHLIPYTCTKKLWQTLGEPPIVWIPSGHYGAAIFLTYARIEAIRFLVKNLSGEKN